MIPSDIKSLPFVPSVYCNPDIAEHRRVETCKPLKANPDFREVGTCQHRGCKGKKFYPHIVDKMNNLVVLQGQTTMRRPDRIKESK
jgi:hypothetical protein